MRLIRAKKFRASIRVFKIFVDDQEIGSISNNESIDLNVKPESTLHVAMGKIKSNSVSCDAECLFIDFISPKNYGWYTVLTSFIGAIIGAILGQVMTSKGFLSSVPVLIIGVIYILVIVLVDKKMLQKNKIGISICDI